MAFEVGLGTRCSMPGAVFVPLGHHPRSSGLFCRDRLERAAAATLRSVYFRVRPSNILAMSDTAARRAAVFASSRSGALTDSWTGSANREESSADHTAFTVNCDLPGQGYSAGIHRRIVHSLDVDIGQESRIVAAGHDLKAIAAQARPQRIGNGPVKLALPRREDENRDLAFGLRGQAQLGSMDDRLRAGQRVPGGLV